MLRGGGLRTEAPFRYAEGDERGGEWRGGTPLPSRLGGLGERCKLPQRDPGRKRILVHFELKNVSGNDKFDIFFPIL